MLRYAITDGEFGRRWANTTLLTGYSSLDQSAHREEARNALLMQARRLAFEGVELFQVREKDLEAGELVSLTRAILKHAGDMKILVNSRVDVAVATGAAGVHLTGQSGELTPNQVRRVFAEAGLNQPVVSLACHTVSEVRQASEAGADLILFGPIFGKTIGGVQVTAGLGLDRLQEASQAAGEVRLLALGGVTQANTNECLAAGASGVAGIRLFQK